MATNLFVAIFHFQVKLTRCKNKLVEDISFPWHNIYMGRKFAKILFLMILTFIIFAATLCACVHIQDDGGGGESQVQYYTVEYTAENSHKGME